MLKLYECLGTTPTEKLFRVYLIDSRKFGQKFFYSSKSLDVRSCMLIEKEFVFGEIQKNNSLKLLRFIACCILIVINKKDISIYCTVDIKTQLTQKD